eukprot:34634-Rhodomonas_salina.1
MTLHSDKTLHTKFLKKLKMSVQLHFDSSKLDTLENACAEAIRADFLVCRLLPESHGCSTPNRVHHQVAMPSHHCHHRIASLCAQLPKGFWPVESEYTRRGWIESRPQEGCTAEERKRVPTSEVQLAGIERCRSGESPRDRGWQCTPSPLS